VELNESKDEENIPFRRVQSSHITLGRSIEGMNNMKKLNEKRKQNHDEDNFIISESL